MYQAGAKDNFDALSYHPYEWTNLGRVIQGVFTGDIGSFGNLSLNSPLNQVMGMRALMVTAGDGDALIWATEYGNPSLSIGEPAQAQYIYDLITGWKALEYTGPLFIHTTKDFGPNFEPLSPTFGIFRADWTPKMAASVIANLIAGVPIARPLPVDPFAALGATLVSLFNETVIFVPTSSTRG